MSPGSHATGRKSNIIFILADNIGWGDFSCYGGSTPTPRIDKLAGGAFASTTIRLNRSARQPAVQF